MAENSKIEWTHHTFNPWVGCSKVSEGCKNCYAEHLMDKRMKKVVWGEHGYRSVTSASYWLQPKKWNEAAKKAGERHRVFCASLADVFEDWRGEVKIEGVTAKDEYGWSVLQEIRTHLYQIIEATPHLDWLLLTKRPENIMQAIPVSWYNGLPNNVWIGTSVENQKAANERIPHLLAVPAAVRFLSCEPLLGPVDISSWLYKKEMVGMEVSNWEETEFYTLQNDLHLVIVGGESGHNARLMHPDWARSLRDQCSAAGVSFFFKQWGEYQPYEPMVQPPYYQNSATGEELFDGHWMNFIDAETGEAGRFQGDKWMDPTNAASICISTNSADCSFLHTGKKAAGRLLDGREWNEMPVAHRGL